MKRILVLLLGIGAPWACQAERAASKPRLEATDLAVFTRVYNGYQRERLDDRRYKPEPYTFGQGQRLDGPMKDASIDKMTFMQIAETIAPALQGQNYVPSFDPQRTKLLIVISWGVTTGSRDGIGDGINQQFSDAYKRYNLIAFPQIRGIGGTKLANGVPLSDPESDTFGGVREADLLAKDSENALALVQSEQQLTRMRDNRNARILGYAEDLNLSDGQLIMYRFRDDLLTDVAYNRYFVILQAYDFQEMLHHEKEKLLWTTRFSIRQRGNSFQERLDTMSRQASR